MCVCVCVCVIVGMGVIYFQTLANKTSYKWPAKPKSRFLEI